MGGKSSPPPPSGTVSLSQSGSVLAGGAFPGSAGKGDKAAGPPRKVRHTGWIVGGLALIFLSGLGALLVGLSLVDESNVLVATRPISAGETIDSGDLGAVAVPAGLADAGISASELNDYVGKVTTGPVGDGAILHPDQFADVESGQMEPDDIIVGLALPPGYYPQLGVRQGDQVRIYELSTSQVVIGDATTTPPAVEVGVGEVQRVTELRQPDNFLFSIRVEAALAGRILEAHNTDRISLGLVVSGSSRSDNESDESDEAGT